MEINTLFNCILIFWKGSRLLFLTKQMQSKEDSKVSCSIKQQKESSLVTAAVMWVKSVTNTINPVNFPSKLSWCVFASSRPDDISLWLSLKMSCIPRMCEFFLTRPEPVGLTHRGTSFYPATKNNHLTANIIFLLEFHETLQWLQNKPEFHLFGGCHCCIP